MRYERKYFTTKLTKDTKKRKAPREHYRNLARVPGYLLRASRAILDLDLGYHVGTDCRTAGIPGLFFVFLVSLVVNLPSFSTFPAAPW
jgi:hypothetical protein